MIAVFHSIFNIATTIILLPFSNTLVKIAKKLVTTDNADGQVVLDERLLLSPGLAVKECLEKTNEMAELARDSFKNALDLFDNYSDSKFDDIEVMEERLDYLEDQLDTFLITYPERMFLRAATTRFQRCFMQSMTSRESEIMR